MTAVLASSDICQCI